MVDFKIDSGAEINVLPQNYTQQTSSRSQAEVNVTYFHDQQQNWHSCS